MYSKKGQGSALNLIMRLVVLLIIVAVVVFLVFEYSGKPNKAFLKCTGIEGGLWVNIDCNEDVSYDSVLAKPIKKGEWEGYHCCGPKPGEKTGFEKEYEDFKNLEINGGGTTNNGGTTTLPPSGGSPGVFIIINGDEMDPMTVHDKTTGEGVAEKTIPFGSEITIEATNTLTTEKYTYCALSIRRAQEQPDGRIGQEKSGGVLVDPPIAIITATTDEACHGTLSLEGSWPKPQAEPEDKVFDFYKIDYTLWKDGVINDSQAAFLKYEDAPEDEYVIYEDIYQTIPRDNYIDCVASISQSINDGPQENFDGNMYRRVEGNSYFSSFNYDFEFLFYYPYNLLYRLKFNYTQTDVFKEVLLTFDSCDELNYMSYTDYQDLFADCESEGCDEYSKSECNSPTIRGSFCNEAIDDCYWENSNCNECGADIQSCSDYEKKDSCTSNQCFEAFEERCFWNSEGFLGAIGCETCNYIDAELSGDPCNYQYSKSTECELDPCLFGEVSFVDGDCHWDSSIFGGTCVSCNYHWPTYDTYRSEDTCSAAENVCNYDEVESLHWVEGGYVYCFACFTSESCSDHDEYDCEYTTDYCDYDCTWNNDAQECEQV